MTVLFILSIFSTIWIQMKEPFHSNALHLKEMWEFGEKTEGTA